MKKMLTLAAMLVVATTALAATRITTRAELAAIANDLTGAYELGCDIDLAGEPWTPIGTNFHKFTAPTTWASSGTSGPAARMRESPTSASRTRP